MREIGVIGERVVERLEAGLDSAAHPLACGHALDRLERLLDRIDDRDNRAREAGIERGAEGLGRIADGMLDATAEVLRLFEMGGSAGPEPRESQEDRLARLEALRDDLARLDREHELRAQRQQEQYLDVQGPLTVDLSAIHRKGVSKEGKPFDFHSGWADAHDPAAAAAARDAKAVRHAAAPAAPARKVGNG